MLPRDSLIDELRPAGRLLLGGTCCLGGAFLGFAAWRAGDPLLIVLALGSGVPLGLIGLALLTGAARAGSGRRARWPLLALAALFAVLALLVWSDGGRGAPLTLMALAWRRR